MKYFYLYCIFGLLVACSSPSKNNPVSKQGLEEQELLAAQNFSIQKNGNITLLSIHSAWKGTQQNFQYVLYPKGEQAPKGYPDARKVAVPVDKILCTSTVDVAFLSALGATDKIVAISNSDFVYNKKVNRAVQAEEITDVGANNAIDYEKALMTAAEIAMVYSIGGESIYTKFEEVGITPVLMADFMEATPLGRAEWMRFVAYFIGKEKLAEQKIKQISKAYKRIQKKAANYEQRPTVLTGAVFNGTWHVAGGQSLMAQFIKDANAQYLWAENEEVSGVPLDFEAVYGKALEADYWINMSHYTSKQALAKSDQRYKDFEAFQQNKLYNYYKRQTANGGTDIFESAIVQPHILLKDYVHIFHSPSPHADSLYYYIPLN